MIPFFSWLTESPENLRILMYLAFIFTGFRIIYLNLIIRSLLNSKFTYTFFKQKDKQCLIDQNVSGGREGLSQNSKLKKKKSKLKQNKTQANN